MLPAQHSDSASAANAPHEGVNLNGSLRNPIIFALLLVAEVWLAHGLIFFAHEYSHSFVAWSLGFKVNPLLLHFGRWNFWNIFAMIEMDENVDYGPVFANGRGAAAALMAVAGPLSAAPLYILSVFGYAAADSLKPVKMFCYLLCLMCVGNFIDYVPIRTFSPIDDMYILEKGLNCSPWLVLFGLGVPFLAFVMHFFLRLLPDARQNLFRGYHGRKLALVFVSTFLLFVFFGAAGLESGTGTIAHWLSRLSIFGGFPLATIALWPRRKGLASTL